MSRRKIKLAVCTCCGSRVSEKSLRSVKGLWFKGRSPRVCNTCWRMSEEKHNEFYGRKE